MVAAAPNQKHPELCACVCVCRDSGLRVRRSKKKKKSDKNVLMLLNGHENLHN